MNWTEATKRIRSDLEWKPELVRRAGGVETYEYLIGRLVEMLIESDLSAKDVALMSGRIFAETAREFGREDILKEIGSEADIEAYLSHCKKALGELGIEPSPRVLKMLTIADFFFFGLTGSMSGVIRGESFRGKDRMVKVQYQRGDVSKTFFAPRIALELGVVIEGDLRATLVDGFPFDFVYEAEVEPYLDDLLPSLCLNFVDLFKYAEKCQWSERWMRELWKLKAVIISVKGTTAYAFGLKDAGSGSVMCLGLADKLLGKPFSIRRTIVHETDHLRYFRELKEAGVRAGGTVLFELTAELATLRLAEAFGEDEVAEFIRKSIEQLMAVASGDLASTFKTEEWKLVSSYYQGVDDPGIWQKVLDAWDRALN